MDLTPASLGSPHRRAEVYLQRRIISPQRMGRSGNRWLRVARQAVWCCISQPGLDHRLLS